MGLKMEENYGISKTLLERVKTAIELNLKTQIRKIIPSLHPADQSELICSLNKNEREELVKSLGNKFDPEVLLELPEDIRNDVISYIKKVALFCIY